MKPITPAEARAKKVHTIPDSVIVCWNDMIVAKLNGKRAVVKQDEVVIALTERMGVTRNEVFDNHWLDIEGIFQDAGWKVYYDKPSYGDSYQAYFEFTTP